MNICTFADKCKWRVLIVSFEELIDNIFLFTWDCIESRKGI